MESTTKVFISFAQNPAVAESLQGMNIGDKVKLEGNFTIEDLKPDGVTLAIEAMVPEDYEVKEEAEAAPAPPRAMAGSGMADQTMPTMMASMVGKK